MTALGSPLAQAGALRAARLIGKGMAMRLTLGFPLPASEAYRIGLVNYVTPADELQSRLGA